MCGILGYYLKESRPRESRVEAALETLRHRGPDGRGVFAEGRILLGHTRLSIIDLSTGDQPMPSADKSLWVTFNGEIYNYVELKEELQKKGHEFMTTSDTEVILHLYEDYGTDCLKYLRGMFAFAVWDVKKEMLLIARDRMGVKPIVYTETDKGFFFASEIQALFALEENIPKECDLSAIDYFLSLQYIPSPLTGFRSIRSLQPAHYMVIHGGKIRSMERYWDIPSECTKMTFHDACARLKELVMESTKIRLRSDVPFGAFLSGGIDSGIIVAAMSRILNSPVRTFSLGFGVKGYDHLPLAKRVAELYKTRHTEFKLEAAGIDVVPDLIKALGQPLGDSSIIPSYYISKLTSGHVKVALTGDGGDETFAGYKRFSRLSFINLIQRYRLSSLWKMGRRATLFAEGMLNEKRKDRKFPFTKVDKALSLDGVERYMGFITIFSESEKQNLYTPLLREAKVNISSYFDCKFKGKYGLKDYLYAEQTSFLPEDILFKVDICSMANSLECRSPLLDHRLIEFASALPDDYKLHRSTGKFILRETFKDWFPPGFFENPKIGFASPTHIWLQGESGRRCRAEIMSSRPLAKLLRKEALKEILGNSEADSKKTWSLFVLSQWVKAFGIEL